jgi:glycopeptide antibiotics resistance protein
MRERLRLAHVLWALTGLSILLLTAAPFHFDTSLHSGQAHWSRIRINPLISPDTGRRISIPDFVQNLLLFIPFGAATVWAFGSHRVVRPVISAVLLGCALSVSAESIQLLTTDRISSFGDVLANTMGAFTGAMTVIILRGRQWADHIRLAKSGVAAPRTYDPMLATALLVCIASWAPFDVTLDVGVVAGHVRALQASFWQPSFSVDHIIVFVQFVLFGFMLTQWLRELHVRSPVMVGIATALSAGILLEASQIFIESRLPTVAAALVNATGGVAGAVTSAAGADVRSKLRALTLVCLFGAGVAAVQWIYSRDARFSAVRDIGLCVLGAYVCIWSGTRILATRRTDHH